MPSIPDTLSRQVLASAEESAWADTREAERVIIGAVFGLITAVIQIWVRRVVALYWGRSEYRIIG